MAAESEAKTEDAPREGDEPPALRDEDRTEAAAFAALAETSKPDALANLACACLAEPAAPLSGDAVREKAKALELGDDDGSTPFGDAVAVLARGPEDAAERLLARALGALAMATAKADDHQAADTVLRLAGKTAFDPSVLLDEALGERADGLFTVLAARAHRIGVGEATDRADAALACAVLLASKRPRAQREIERLSGEATDPLLRLLLSKAKQPEARLDGEMVAPPRSAALTVLLGITGLLFVAAAVKLVLRYVLAYKCPAQVSASAAGVRIHARTELLGRTLRDREIVIGKDALVRAVREVRFPRLGLYAGLLSLAIGTYVGVGALVDGTRAASPSLLLFGLLLVAGGIALDLLFSSVLPGAKGRCRVVLAPRRGRSVCIGNVDPKRADAALATLR